MVERIKRKTIYLRSHVVRENNRKAIGRAKLRDVGVDALVNR